MFIDQKGILPFPKITPIRLPFLIEKIKKQISIDSLDNNKTSINEIKDLSLFFNEWFSPLINLENYPYVYFMNNGITQGLETIALLNLTHKIKLIKGDYFWLKSINAAEEVNTLIDCDLSYSTNPSSIDGNIKNFKWPSKAHILDCAYVGTSLTPITIPENTEFVLLGFSKNLGIPEHRLGLLFSKKLIPHLETFQKIFLYLGIDNFRSIKKICEDIGILELAGILKDLQLKYCNLHPEFIPSDSALIVTTNDQKYKFYKRTNDIIRIPIGESIDYCLSNNIL
jgi:hypothetical protein